MRKYFLILFLFLFLTPNIRAQAESNLALGYKCLGEGNPQAAQAYFAEEVKSLAQELSDYVLFGAARSKYELKNYDLAAQDFEKLTAEHKDSILLEEAGFYLIDCFIRSKNSDEALQQIEKYLAKFPDGKYAAHVLYLKGEISNDQNDFRQAYKIFNEVDYYYPLSFYAKKSRLEMKKLAKKHKFAAYSPNPKKLYEKGEAYFESGDYESAANTFNRLARLFPKHKLSAKAFLMLGRAEMERGLDNSSIKNIEKSYKLSTGSQSGRILYYLGRAHGRRGRYEKAIDAMSKLVQNFPSGSYADDAWYYLGIYYEKTGKPQYALSSYLTLVRDYPNSSWVDDAVLGAGHIYYVKGDFENSFKTYSLAKGLRTGDETPQCLFFWGLTAEKLGKRDQAAGIYYYLADKLDHTYQSYRARDKLIKLGYMTPGEKVSISNALSSSEIDETEIEQVMERWRKKNAHLIDSKEVQLKLSKYQKLMELGLYDFALLEARDLISKTEGESQKSAQLVLGKVMQKSGEYTIPIRYVERSIKNSVLSGASFKIPNEAWVLAYPKGYWDYVFSSSKKYGIDPYLTLAVIREESRFNPRALSRSHAHGLMQIIPSTGKIIAKQLEIEPFRKRKMFEVETNIEMGTYYLSNLIKRFDGNVALALAGYNGGPARVRKWVNNWYNGDNVNLDIDEFVQNIPLRETRYYVQKVLGSFYEYKRLYDRRT